MTVRYVALEGIDACGKNMQAERLAAFWRSEGHAVEDEFEPDERNGVGLLLRRWLSGGRYGRAHAALFLADRLCSEGLRRAALAEGRRIVQVRSFLSTLVYQQAQWPLPHLTTMHAGVLLPDLVVVLDVSVPEALARLHGRGGVREHYERSDVLAEARRQYLFLALLRPCGVPVMVVDGEGTPEAVAEQVRLAVEAHGG